jgi:hypothetical protein
VKKLVAEVANVPASAAENVMLATSTGFPGLPGDPACKQKFNIVVAIS